MNIVQPARRLLILLAVLPLAGCIHVPIYTATLTSSELRQVNEFDLCAAYQLNESKRLRAEIDRRNLISPEEWNTVARHQVAEGMGTCGVLASLGYPADTEEEEDPSSPESLTTRFIYLDDLLVITYDIRLRDGVAVEVRR